MDDRMMLTISQYPTEKSVGSSLRTLSAYFTTRTKKVPNTGTSIEMSTA